MNNKTPRINPWGFVFKRVLKFKTPRTIPWSGVFGTSPKLAFVVFLFEGACVRQYSLFQAVPRNARYLKGLLVVKAVRILQLLPLMRAT
jgi:hypothetical protein